MRDEDVRDVPPNVNDASRAKEKIQKDPKMIRDPLMPEKA